MKAGLAIVIALGLFVAHRSLHAADPRFDSLLPKIPPAANVVVLVDVEGLFKSSLGLEQSWAKR
jgi:hypothetical protein